MQLTTTQAAAEKGVQSDTIRQWIRKGWIPAQKLGRDYLIDADLLRNFERPELSLIRGRRRKAA